MGLLSQGSPLNWEETKKYADHIRKHGIIQFLNIYNKVKERQKDVLKWGDEVRNKLYYYLIILFKINRCIGNVVLSVNASDPPFMMVVHDAIVALNLLFCLPAGKINLHVSILCNTSGKICTYSCCCHWQFFSQCTNVCNVEVKID